MKKERFQVKKYVDFILAKVEDFTKFDSPMAIYNWLLGEWERPFRGQAYQYAYKAAWVVSIDKGLVKL